MLSGTWYHGSPRSFTHFSRPSRYSPQEQLGFGIHFARKVDFAKLYGNVIYKCQLNPAKVLDISKGMAIKPGTKYDSLAKDFFRGSGISPYFIDKEHYVFGEGIIDRRSPKTAEGILKKHGYDAVIYHAKYGTMTFNGQSHGTNLTSETTAVTMLDPSRITIVAKKVIESKKKVK